MIVRTVCTTYIIKTIGLTKLFKSTRMHDRSTSFEEIQGGFYVVKEKLVLILQKRFLFPTSFYLIIILKFPRIHFQKLIFFMYVVLDKFLFVMRSCSVKEPIFFQSNVNNYIQLQRNKKKLQNICGG